MKSKCLCRRLLVLILGTMFSLSAIASVSVFAQARRQPPPSDQKKNKRPPEGGEKTDEQKPEPLPPLVEAGGDPSHPEYERARQL